MKYLGIAFLFLSIGLVSCKAVSSGVSSTSVKFSNLPDGVDGYSVCVERKNVAEAGCSEAFLSEKKKDEDLSIKLNKNCPTGYKLKMWLWSTKKEGATTSNTTNVMYGVNSEFKGTDNKNQNTYENGYLLIPKEKLSSDKLALKINLLPVKGAVIPSSSGSGDGKVDLDIHVEIEGSESTSTPATTTTASSQKTIDFEAKCVVSADSAKDSKDKNDAKEPEKKDEKK